MAFNSFLRRASASILSLGIGSAGRVISGVVNIEKRQLVGRQFLPFRRFSTLYYDRLLGLIESDNSRQRSSPFLIDYLDEFPFGIEENREYKIEEDKKFLLRRKYKDEIIEVAVDGYEVIDDTPRIPLNAHLLRGTQQLLFEMIAQPNRIKIQSCIIKDTGVGHFKAFQSYLEIRGFNSSTINFLLGLLESNCTAQQYSNVPDGFPFEIRDRHEKGVIFITRRFQDEGICADVSGLSTGECSTPRSFQMSIKIIPSRQQVQSNFEITVTPILQNPIFIHQVTMRALSGGLEDFQKFWEIRGIKPSTTNLLFDYFNKKVEQRYRRCPGLKLLPQVPTYECGQQQI